MYNFDGTFKETLYFTDNDIFVDDGTNEYTPLSITFGTLKEDGSMQSDSIDISLDNVNSEISYNALTNEWRNNRASIKRVIYLPADSLVISPDNYFEVVDYMESPETYNDYYLNIGADYYEFGFGQNLIGYPKLDLTPLSKDIYVLFEGIIDTFNATESTLSGTITTLFTNWNKPYPVRKFDQNEFTTIVDTMAESIQWGY
jgi:hypothetical protein